MACQFEYSPPRSIALCRLSGPLDDKHLKRYYRAMAECSRHLQPQVGITDFSEVAPVTVTAAVVRELAWSVPALADPELPRYLVAPNDHIYGLMRMFQLHSRGTRPQLHIVHKVAEAYLSLGIATPLFHFVPGFDQD